MLRVVQAGNQLHQGRLARPVVAHDRHCLAPGDPEAYVIDRRLVFAFVRVAHVAELDALLDRVAERYRMFRRAHQRLEVEQLEQCLEVQLVLVHRLQPAEQGRECLRNAGGRLDVQRQATHADRAAERAKGDVEKRQSIGENRQHGPRRARQVPPNHQRPILSVIALEQA